jgi:hypothetical protein
MPTWSVSLGSIGVEFSTDQLLPLGNPKADVAYEEIVLRRSNWLECLLSDPETDLEHGPSQ